MINKKYNFFLQIILITENINNTCCKSCPSPNQTPYIFRLVMSMCFLWEFAILWKKPSISIAFLESNFPRFISPHYFLKQSPFFEILHLSDFSFKLNLVQGSLSSNGIPMGQVMQGLVFSLFNPPKNLLIPTFDLKL